MRFIPIMDFVEAVSASARIQEEGMRFQDLATLVGNDDAGSTDSFWSTTCET